MTTPAIEERLESLGHALRARPSVGERVLLELRTSVETGAMGRKVASTRVPARRRRWPVFVSLVGGLSAAAMLAISLIRTPQTTWADVIDAIGAKQWIHARLDDDGTEFWLSQDLGLWAYKSRQRVMFWDAPQDAKYEFRFGQNRITRYPLGPDEIDRILTVNDRADGTPIVGPWLLGTEQIVAQRRREVVVDGKSWIEFDIELARGTTKFGTLRVEPKSKLPIALVFRATPGAEPTYRWAFDYPEDGPRDVYALGVREDVAVDDHLLPEEPAQVLTEMAISRQRLGNFRMLVAAQPMSLPYYFVWRKGDRWRVDTGLPQGAEGPATGPAPDQPWDAWWQEQLERCHACPWYRCDGQAVYENADSAGFLNGGPLTWKRAQTIGPQALMSANRGGGLPPWIRIVQMLFPDLTPQPWFRFEFDPHPADADGCVLVKISAESTNPKRPRANEWYWIDPSKGYAVARAELFSLAPGVPAEPSNSDLRQTLRMEEFQQSPEGFWYPAVIRESAPIGPHGDGPAPAERTQREIRYYIDFAPELDDSLFEPT